MSFHYPKQRYWFYGGAAALTIITGASRVIAGMHHPTDVIVGGLLGAGIGYGVAKLHTGKVNVTAQMVAPSVFMIQGSW